MTQSFICMDCSRTVPSISRGRCPRCLPFARAEQNAKHGDRTGRMTPERAAHHRFKNSPAWRKLRLTIIARDGGCADCGREDNLSVHHIKKFRTHPELALDPDNLITVCRSCHGRREARESRGPGA
jgi:5-methylcytosine-specific restriction enzyme A